MTLARRLCELMVVFCLVSGTFLNVVAFQAGPAGLPKDIKTTFSTIDTAPTSRDATSRAGPDPDLFMDPPMEDRVLPIMTNQMDQWSRDKFESLGVGGLVVNNWNWDKTGLDDANAKNWSMWVNDYYMYPSGSANPYGGVNERLWNPSFEQHNLNVWPDGWQWTYTDWPKYDLSMAKSHSGVAAVAADSMNSYIWAIAVRPGDTYELSLWAREDQGAEIGKVTIVWCSVNAALSGNQTVFQSGPDYARYSVTAKAPPGATIAKILIMSNDRNEYVWYDDVMFQKIVLPVTNTAVNPSFEADVDTNNIPDGWFYMSPPIYDTSGTRSHTGTDSVGVNGTNIYFQAVPAVAGKDYYCGEWLVSSGGPILGQLVLLWFQTGNIIGISQQILVINDTYTYYDFLAVAPEGTDTVVIAIASASDSYIYADDVMFYQTPSLNDGVSRGPILDGHPELEAQGLYYAFEDVMAPQKSNLTLPNGKLLSAIAAPIAGAGALNLDNAVDLTSQVTGRKVVYQPTSGRWRVMAFTYDILMNGTEVDPAISNMHQINVMNKVAVERFIEEMYNKTIYQKTSEYWGNMIKASFTDEVSNLAGYFIPQQYPVVAWLHDDVNSLYLEDTFQSLHGYDLTPKLPALFNDVGPKTSKYRVDFYNTTAYLQGEAYYKMIGDWCTEHGINFSGHLLGEDTILQHTAFYGDYFESAKHMGYPGIDALIRTGDTRNIDDITPKMASSTSVLYGKPHTMTEYSVATTAWDYRNMTAVANWQMVQGIDRVTSFAFYVGVVPDDTLKRHVLQVGRSCYMLQQGEYSTEIAILYPITSFQSEYIPSNATIWSQDKFPTYKHDVSFTNLTRTMLGNQLDFIYINDENVLSASVANVSGKAALHHDVSGLDLKVLVVPEMNTIRTETMERIKEFYDAGGIVVAVGDLPTASAENGTDDYIDTLVQAVFDTNAVGGNGYNQRTNSNGGVSIWADGDLSVIETPLRKAMQEDFLVADPTPASVYYMKRTDPNFDIYYLVNNDKNSVYRDVSFRTLGDPSFWNPETGMISAVSGSDYSYDPVTGYTTIKNSGVAGWSSAFVVFDKPVIKLYAQNLTFDPDTPLVGDDVIIGLNVSNIGKGIAPQVKITIYDGDPDDGGLQIGTADTLTIGAGAKQHVERTWDTSAVTGIRNITARACLPDGTCVKVQKSIFVNSVPKSAILVNRTEAYTFEEFNFTSNSTDYDGLLNNTTWDLGDGTVAYTNSVTHEYSDNGTYTVTLKVADSNGTWNQTSVKVTVLNRGPSANFTASPGISGDYTTEFRFNASGSADRDGTIVNYRWDVGDGSKVLYQGLVLNYSYLTPGNYTVVLTVTDNDGAQAKVNKTIIIINLAPTANFTFKPKQGIITVPFEFESTSLDPDGSVVAYNWSFGDGTYSDKAAPTHKYSDDKVYNVTLMVRDNIGLWSANVTKPVVVINLPPWAKASPSDQTIVFYKGHDGRANFSANGTTDLDDKLSELTFEWDFGDNSPNASGMQTSHVYTKAGKFNVTLKVTDDNGASSIIKVNVTVYEREPKPPEVKGVSLLPLIGLLLIIIGVVGAIGYWRFRKDGMGSKSKEKEKDLSKKASLKDSKDEESKDDTEPDDSGSEPSEEQSDVGEVRK